MADTDCQAGPAVTPGETAGPGSAPIIVTAHPTGSTLSFTYGATGCGVANNTLIWGPLDPVNPYSYLGEDCGPDNSGSYTWTFPSGSVYFLMVARDGSNEGSYGRDSSGVERPPDLANPTCFLARDLTNPCP